MFPRLPRSMLKLTRRLSRPATVRRLVRQAADLMAALPQLGEFSRQAPGTSFRTAPPAPAPVLQAGVQEVPAFGTNPGGLRMLTYTPPVMPPMGAPLIVVLHGCQQQAARFAADAGWLALADRLGVALLLPEQTGDNNPAHCFNWFRPEDVARGQGEAQSIRQMVTEAQRRFGSDPKRVFVAGLSAGGGMAAALLAAYPELFAAGAVVAGLPVGVATDVTSALTRMSRAATERAPETLAARARAAGPAGYAGPWPRLSIWQGAADRTVDPHNADLLARQWTGLHGMADTPARDTVSMGGIRRRSWGQGRVPAVELWTIDHMGHGFPVDGDHAASDRWVLDAGISGTDEIARFWGLMPALAPA